MVQDTNLAFYDTRQSKLIKRTAFNMPKAAKQQTTTRPSPIAVKSEHVFGFTGLTSPNLMGLQSCRNRCESIVQDAE
jgi:hypothetical protein